MWRVRYPRPRSAGDPWKPLARAESPGAVAAALVAWEHPLGHPLLKQARQTRPDLFRLEAALVRFMAEYVSLAARRSEEGMRRFVRESVDQRNIVTAVLLAGARFEGQVGEAFADAGGELDRRHFVRAASAQDREGAAEVLAHALRRTPFERALRAAPSTPSGISERILQARIARLARGSRHEPVTSLPVLLYILRLRREAARVRRALWTASLREGAR